MIATTSSANKIMRREIVRARKMIRDETEALIFKFYPATIFPAPNR